MDKQEYIEVLRKGSAIWNQWRDENIDLHIDLSSTDFSDATLSGAKLDRVDLSKSILNCTNLKDADLSYADLRSVSLHSANLYSANLRLANLSSADFFSANLSHANLSNTNLINADLRFAKLNSANLSSAALNTTQMLHADLTGATLTGACIADWHIGDTTKLDRIVCRYIFRTFDELKKQFSGRLPVDLESEFAPGEFTQRFRILTSALETIDITFTEGIDWQAFFETFQELCLDHPHENISVQSLERKGAAFIVRLEVAANIDKAIIETHLKQMYGERLAALEAEYKEKFLLQSQQFAEKLKIQSSPTYIVQVMAENSSTNNFYGPVGNFVAGDNNGSMIASINENKGAIDQLIESLRGFSKAFSTEEIESVKETLDDLVETLKQPHKQTPTRLKRFIGILLGIAIGVGGGVATATDFANNVLELSDKFSIPPQTFKPQLQQLKQMNPNFMWKE